MRPLTREIHFVQECRALGWGLWQCPPFLVIAIGAATIVSMLATHVFASRLVEEPEIAALIVIGVTTLFLIFGHFIVAGFAKVAEANRAKSEFISIVSHQLRSPLSIFKWTLERAERAGPPSPNDSGREDAIRTLRDTAEIMIRLVNSLMEISRIEASSVILKEEPVSLTDLTRRVVRNYERYARASALSIRVAATEGARDAIADAERAGMVIQNLVDNAVRHGRGPGEIAIAIEPDPAGVRWTITDQGAGIPEEHQKRLFQKFFRAPERDAAPSQGSGIGLYAARLIIEASGGSMGFRSREGRGSTFWFTLPTK